MPGRALPCPCCTGWDGARRDRTAIASPCTAHTGRSARRTGEAASRTTSWPWQTWSPTPRPQRRLQRGPRREPLARAGGQSGKSTIRVEHRAGHAAWQCAAGEGIVATGRASSSSLFRRPLGGSALQHGHAAGRMSPPHSSNRAVCLLEGLRPAGTPGRAGVVESPQSPLCSSAAVSRRHKSGRSEGLPKECLQRSCGALVERPVL